MNDIYEISKPSIQSDWRGIVFENVSVKINELPDCENCWCKSSCGIPEYDKNFAVVTFSFYNTNSFPIYSEFVNDMVAIRTDGEQIGQTHYDICKGFFEQKYRIHNNNTIMPYSTQKRLIIFDNVFDDERKLIRLDYRGKIYSRYEECNWGYVSYNLQTGELLTNGSLNYIQKINEEQEKRKREKLYKKPYKLISELEVLLYKRNDIPVTYKDFVSLTIKAQGHLKELTELNKHNKLGLDTEIEQFKSRMEKTFSEETVVFKKLTTLSIKSPEQNITPEEFEHYVAAHFSESGYKAEVTRYVLDGGIDIVLTKGGKTYGVQCKYLLPERYVDTVDMLHFLGALINMRADGGFFVTTGKITVAGNDIANRNGITIILVR